MRWRFPDPSEEQDRRRVLALIDAFWAAFRDRQSSLVSTARKKELPDTSWLGPLLKAVHPALSWEIASPSGPHPLLALSSEGQHQLGPLLDAILARAPRDLSWIYASAKPPKSIDEARQFFSQVHGRSLDGWRCQIRQGPHQIDLLYGIPGCTGPKDRDAHLAALAASDALLGGALFDRWIGAVHILPAEALDGGVPLEDVLPGVEAAREAIRQKLPDKPVFSTIDAASWTLHRFNPRRRESYPFRVDLVVGKSMFPALWQHVHARVSFYSERFSRLGETFCYLKLDGDEGFGDGGFEDKNELEDALDEALGDARLGCVIGGGSGLRYSYVDLALLDVGAAVEILRRVLREGKAPRRTWLLFFDDDLASEWVAFRPRTPPPP